MQQIHSENGTFGDFPGGLMVKNPPSDAGDLGWIPGQGTKTPQAPGQLIPRAATTEPAHHNQREAHATRGKFLHAATKVPCATTKTLRS